MHLVVLPFSCFSAFWMILVTLVCQEVVTVYLGPIPISTVHSALLIPNQLSLVEILVAVFCLTIIGCFLFYGSLMVYI